jgi:poly(3-hydroxybutyrate) depolymerase
MSMKFYILLVIAIASLSTAHAQQTAKVTATGIKYLEYLPDGYHNNTNDYPVVISLHGIGERGNDLNKVSNVSLAKYIKLGQKYPFIVISPQLKSGGWSPDYVMQVVKHVKNKLRINDKKVYLTGLSLGGFGVWKTAVAYPDVFAAIAPICGGGNALSQASNLAKEKVPVWAFHGNNDKRVNHSVSVKMVNAINNSTPKPSPQAKLTIYPGMGHSIWDKVYKESSVLNWLVSHTNGSSPSNDDNEDDDGEDSNDDDNAFSVNAGSDKQLTLPTNSITLQGSTSVKEDASYSWSKLSGGTADLNGSNSPSLTVTNLKEGTYVFRLTVKNDGGDSKHDDVKVVVKPSDDGDNSNKAPIVSAGPDKTIRYPRRSITLVGTARDPDGSIASYKWTQVSGPNCSMDRSSTSKLFTYRLKKGTYVYRLTVKDNKGATKSQDVRLTVKS